MGCMCTDCSKACPAPPALPPSVLRWQVPFANGSINFLVLFTGMATMLALLSVFLVSLLEDSQEEPAAGPAQTPGGKVEDGAEIAGGQEEEIPPRVVAGVWSGVVVFSLMALLFTPPRLITDPPGSKASENRAFFNTHFGPFWRSEMIIARPFKDATLGLHDKPSGVTDEMKDAPGGSAVTHNLLSQLLDLQLSLEAISVSCQDAK
ncbi:hypothetical protein T484DRAFT_1785804 [Baffinella frigidus]|nr:hypothetical protein T484DRAFT_1785804 [Cryptophyta sp. CCMP2293]